MSICPGMDGIRAMQEQLPREARLLIVTPERANKVWKQILNKFEAPPMDDAIREELQAFVALRKEQGGAPTDF